MYHVSAQGVDERMINVHYDYYYLLHERQNLRKDWKETGSFSTKHFTALIRPVSADQQLNIYSQAGLGLTWREWADDLDPTEQVRTGSDCPTLHFESHQWPKYICWLSVSPWSGPLGARAIAQTRVLVELLQPLLLQLVLLVLLQQAKHIAAQVLHTAQRHQSHTTWHIPSITHHLTHTINHTQTACPAYSPSAGEAHSCSGAAHSPTPSITHHQTHTLNHTPPDTHPQSHTTRHTPSITHHQTHLQSHTTTHPQSHTTRHTLNHTPPDTHHQSHTTRHTLNHTPPDTHHQSHTTRHTPSITPPDTPPDIHHQSHTIRYTPSITHHQTHTPSTTHHQTHTPSITHHQTHTPSITHHQTHTPSRTDSLSCLFSFSRWSM